MEKDYFKGGKRTWKVYGRATTPVAKDRERWKFLVAALHATKA